MKAPAPLFAQWKPKIVNIIRRMQGRRGYGIPRAAPARQAEARQSADGARPVWCAPCGTITVIRADPSGSSSLTISASRIGAGFRITCLRELDNQEGEKIEGRRARGSALDRPCSVRGTRAQLPRSCPTPVGPAAQSKRPTHFLSDAMPSWARRRSCRLLALYARRR